MKNFLIYKSSAGSGKTYTLVKEYLRIVLSNPENYRHTLAITFTNKAVEEMKNRIVDKLIELSEDKDEELKQALESEGVSVNIPEQAKLVLNSILHNYFYFSVLTIDSFFHRIIRSFAKELKLHIGFDVEINEDEVLSKITDDLLSEIGTDAELTSYLEEFALTRIEENKDWKIDKLITKIGKEIFKERFREKKNNPAEDITENRRLLREFINSLFENVRDFENEMTSISRKANEIVNNYGLDIYDFQHGKFGCMNYLLNKIQNGGYEPTSRVREVYKNPKKFFKPITKDSVIQAVEGGLKQLLTKAVDLYDKNFRRYSTSKELTKTIYVIGIFKDLLDKLKTYRDEKRIMLISDANNILQKVISGETSPFVYEKTGSVYKYFLIDEFQDTSGFQWANLLPLVINSLGENNFSMVVGDVKQSIFRWRNGNMLLLLEKIYEHLAGFREIMEDKYLDKNFRSGKEIVNFNNTFFTNAVRVLGGRDYVPDTELIAKAYIDVEQNITKCKEGGYVNITFLDRDENEELSTTERAGSKLLETVASLVNDNVPPKDIMILVRYNREGSEAASILLENGYRVVSSESMILTNSPKVKLLINLLKYLADHRNTLAKTEVLYNYSLLKNLNTSSRDIFTDYMTGKLFNNLLPEDFFKKDGKGNDGRTRINPELNNIALYELIEKLTGIFGLGEKPDAYLLRFKDAVLEYERKNNSDIVSFLDWWEDNKDKLSIIVPEQENAIRIMTIHRAKGLESPVVVIPYVSWLIDVEGDKEFIWVSTDEAGPFNQSPFLVRAVSGLRYTYFERDYYEEAVQTNLDNLNLLYVAFTRAVERLYVFVPERKDRKYSAGNLVKETISVTPGLIERYNIEKGEFETGSKTIYAERKKERGIKPLEIKGYGIKDLYSKVVILPKHKSLKLLHDKELSSKISRGILLHEVLAHVKAYNDIDSAISLVQTKSALGGFITDDMRGEIKKELEEIISIDEVKSWFAGDWDIRTESEIILPDGKIYRPDRVMIKDKTAIVADYKTGSPKPEDEKQLNDYAEALHEAGYNPVDKFILYIENRKVRKL